MAQMPKFNINLSDIEDVNTYILNLLNALERLVLIAEEARDAWDSDNDMRVGKILIALSGHLPGYRKDIDDIHAIIKKGNPMKNLKVKNGRNRQ